LTSLCIAFYDFPLGEELKLVVERSFGKHSRKRNTYLFIYKLELDKVRVADMIEVLYDLGLGQPSLDHLSRRICMPEHNNSSPTTKRDRQHRDREALTPLNNSGVRNVS
jgi:hypothetical protein